MNPLTTSETSTRQFSLQDFVAGLHTLVEQDFATVEAPLRYMREHPIDPDTVNPYLFWNTQHYTRNLIEKTDLYELLAICWDVGMHSSIHNHKGQNCWMAAPIGRLAVQNYRVLAEDLSAKRCHIEPTNIVEISPTNPVAVDPANPVHDVRNPREWGARAVSLHLYSRPFDSCIVYSAEKGTCGEIGLNYTSVYGKLL